jgi:uncharacterized membrane protein
VSRTLRQNEQILAWAEEGLLDAQQMSVLAEQDPFAPDAADWKLLVERVCTAAGVILLSAGVIFFFAWNWEAMHRFAKFALALGGLSAFAALAFFASAASIVYRSALLGCCIATGSVLALIGQTYQTGADVWQLFALWALLMIPWASLSGSAACWGLFWAVGQLALLAFFGQSQWHGLFVGLEGYQALLVIALANLALLVIFERFYTHLLAQPGRAVQRLACFALLAALGSGGAAAWWSGEYMPLLFASLLGSGAMLVFYRQVRLDLPILAMTLFWLIISATSGLIRLTGEMNAFFLMINAVGAFVLVSSALAFVWLTRLFREHQS